MTDFNVGILIKANAAQAKAELASDADRTKVFGTQTRAAGVDARTTATVLTAYELRVNVLEAQLRQLIAAQTEAAAKAKAMPQAFNGGAQSVGNMAARFNDITVMLAAGQNPLQLAIQQGTQITQGFGTRLYRWHGRGACARQGRGCHRRRGHDHRRGRGDGGLCAMVPAAR